MSAMRPAADPAAFAPARLPFIAGAVLAFVVASGSRAAEVKTPPLPAPTYPNVSYGTHERHVLDFWAAPGSSPAPLAVFVHGGGFVGGDKARLAPGDLAKLIEGGVSVAAVNYRFLPHAKLPAAFHDVARAVQFLRHQAAAWRINPERVGGFGGSAGAQIVMFLAFHEDLADPKSPDPVARLSTRLACVAPQGGQASMDLPWLDEHIPFHPQRINRPASLADWNDKWFGADGDAARRIIADISALALLSPDDPPLFMNYGMAPDGARPADPQAAENWIVHHVAHGLALQRRAQAVGVEVHLRYPGARVAYASGVDFLIQKLKVR